MSDNRKDIHIEDLERLENLERSGSSRQGRQRGATQEELPEVLYRLKTLHSCETFYGSYEPPEGEWPHFRTLDELEALLEGLELADFGQPVTADSAHFVEHVDDGGAGWRRLGRPGTRHEIYETWVGRGAGDGLAFGLALQEAADEQFGRRGQRLGQPLLQRLGGGRAVVRADRRQRASGLQHAPRGEQLQQVAVSVGSVTPNPIRPVDDAFADVVAHQALIGLVGIHGQPEILAASDGQSGQISSAAAEVGVVSDVQTGSPQFGQWHYDSLQ